MKTSAAASAAAIGGGRLLPVDLARVHRAQHGLGAGARGGVAQRVAERAGRGVDDDDDLLARPDAEALADDGLDGLLELAHRVVAIIDARPAYGGTRDSLLRVISGAYHFSPHAPTSPPASGWPSRARRGGCARRRAPS